ncbi:MAG: TonB-dependent receptor, partial [Pseudopedobacter saltans]
PTTNTSWYNELLKKNALIHSHSLDVSGGSNKVNYTIGLNYLYQDGILKAENDFQRYNIRLQTEAKPYDWLKVGYTAIITNSTLFSPNTGAFMNAYYASPLYPVYDPSNTSAFPKDYASSVSIGFNNGVFNNPVATADYYYDRTKSFQILPTVYAEANIWGNKLTFRSQWSMRYASNSQIKYTPEYYVDNNQRQAKSNLWSAQNRYNEYIVDNLLTYKDGKNGHHWSVMLGQSSREQRWRQTWVSADSVPNVEEFWYVNQGVQTATNYGEDGYRNAGLSYFSRVTYDYKNRYLLTATFRADGSSKYQTKWGYFPSIGLGWVMSDEDFMKNQKLFQFLKLRGSWGKLGNDGITPNAGYATVQTGNNYSGIYGSTGTTNGNYVIGYFVNSFFTPITWEVVNEWDGGLDFTMINNKLKGSVDYYHRTTNNVAFAKTQAFTNTTLYGNWASVANSGWEFNLNWNDNIGPKFSYNIGANLTTLKNRVTDLGSLSYMMTGVSEFPTRIEVGQPINYFFGYEMTGIYQNQAEISADPTTTGQGIQPGYFKYKDQNGDGVIDANDRVNLGSYLPKFTYGLNIGMSYSAFDLSIALQGVSGNKILNLNRAMRSKYSDMNGDADFVSHLWTGENSTNAYPSAYATTQGWNNQANSFFVESGSYLRVQNIQLGYNFQLGDKGPKMRVYATADRP